MYKRQKASNLNLKIQKMITISSKKLRFAMVCAGLVEYLIPEPQDVVQPVMYVGVGTKRDVAKVS